MEGSNNDCVANIIYVRFKAAAQGGFADARRCMINDKSEVPPVIRVECFKTNNLD
jgi:hypothetical protein